MKLSLVSAAAIVLTAQQVLAGGPIAGCLQTHTVVAGDSCDGIAANFKLTTDEFYAMNPGLHHLGDHICDNLDDGKPYCVCTKKPCVAEPKTSSGNATVSGATSSGAANASASSVIPNSGTLTPSGTASSSSGSTSGGSSSSISSPSSSGSSAGTSASTTSSAANALIIPTMMMGLVGMAVAALL